MKGSDKMKKALIGFILGGIIFGSIGIYATSLYYAKDISYEPSDASWEVSNVNDALNNLYSMKIELDNIKNLGNATAADILSGKTAVVKGKTITGTNDGGTKIVNLGTGTSYNIKTLCPDVDYTSLTINNFIYGMSGAGATSAGYGKVTGDGRSLYSSSTGLNVKGTYNNTTGILTISGNTQTIQGRYYGSGVDNQANSTQVATCFAYLIY